MATQTNGPADQPLHLALPTPAPALKRAAARPCAGAFHEAAARYNGESPGAFASSGPGTADLEVYLDERGKPVAAVTLDASSRAYAEAALEIVARWSFAPATCAGKPVPAAFGVLMQ